MVEHLIYLSDLRRPEDRLVSVAEREEEAREMVRRLNAEALAEHGGDRGSDGLPVPLYFAVSSARD